MVVRYGRGGGPADELTDVIREWGGMAILRPQHPVPMEHRIPFDETAVPEALIRDATTWKPAQDNGGRALCTNGRFRVQQVFSRSGAKPEGHMSQADDALFILSGRLRFSFDDERRTVELGPNDLLGFDRNVPHSIEAVEDTVALLAR